MPTSQSEQAEPMQPAPAQTPDLSVTMTPAQARRAVLQETLRHFQANVPGVMASDDAEFVHQARVALRRLRAAQKTFAAIIPADATTHAHLTAEIRHLATLFGHTRDLDVLLGETLPPIEAALAPHIDFDPLKNTLRQQRNAALRQTRSALRSARTAKLLESLRQSLDIAADQPADASMLRDHARQALAQRWRPVRRLLRRLSGLDREQRHTLRKRAKELRYALEFFAPLFASNKMDRYLKKLQALQAVLGSMNDSVATQHLLEELMEKHAAHIHCGSIVIGWVAAAAKQSEAKLDATGRSLKKSEVFW